jgi:hypothetical protein
MPGRGCQASALANYLSFKSTEKRAHVLAHPKRVSGMDALAATMVGAQVGQVQLALAGKMLRMSADSASSVVKLIDAAEQNLNRLANVATGIGQNLDISA